MSVLKIFGGVAIIFVILLLVVYWFVPFNEISFNTKIKTSNFSLNNSGFENMQFYPNMRYPKKNISYKIDSCTLQKKEDMERAFEILGNQTLLNFYPTFYDEEISITCDDKNKEKGGLFIAGEGGPTYIIQSGTFNVITHGKILLIKQSSCANPNIALHELLHALGFDHSENPNNIMYSISNCRQSIGEDTFALINKLYSIPSYSDLQFEDTSAIVSGKYLDVEMTIRNGGLKKSEISKIIISADDKVVEEIELESLNIGSGKSISIKNIWIPQIKIEELTFFIEHSLEELEKNNNKIIMEVDN